MIRLIRIDFMSHLPLRLAQAFVLALYAVACASNYPATSLNIMSESAYKTLAEKHSTQKQVYDGLINVLDVHATLVTSDLALGQADQNARIYQWSQDQYDQEKTKIRNALLGETQVFVSFFVPDKKHDDLNKGTTKWKMFLDVAGHRYEGTAKKMKAELVEVLALYPEHTRWGTPYLISFKVASSLIDNNPAKLTLTGPAGSVTVDFK